MTDDAMTCAELIELVTHYLDGSLDPRDRQRFDEHLADCPHCSTYLAQIQETIVMAGRLSEATLAPSTRDELLARFHDWRQAG